MNRIFCVFMTQSAHLPVISLTEFSAKQAHDYGKTGLEGQ